MSELKPCPFCGGKPEKIYKSTGQTTHIECPDCHAQFPKSTNENKYDDEWNRRHVDTCTMLLKWVDDVDGECYECSKCNGPTFTHGWLPDYCECCGAKVVRE